MNDDARIIFFSLFLADVRVMYARRSLLLTQSVKCTRSLKNKLLCTWVGFMFLFQTH